MKKLLITAATALTLLLPSIARPDIIFYKNGKMRGDVKSQEITLKLCSVSDDVLNLNRDRILGIKVDERGSLEVVLKDTDGWNMSMGYSSTSDCLKIKIKDDKGNEEIISGEDIKKYLFTNDVVPDKEIIKKCEFINVAGKYFEKLGLTIGESFSFYRDDVKERYILISIDKLKLARNYEYLHVYPSFDKEEIKSLEEKLNAEGRDTYLAVVASAGCSLTPPFVEYGEDYLAGVLFHEWWHENKTDLPLELNEATSTAVGLVCAEDFLSKHPEYKNGSKFDEDIRSRKTYRKYNNAVVKSYEKLSKLYNSEMSDEEKLKAKKRILEDLKEKTGLDMNNAQLSFAITYCRYFDLVDKVINHYPNLKDAVKVLKEIPSSLEEGVKYLEDLLNVEVEKSKIETYY